MTPRIQLTQDVEYLNRVLRAPENYEHQAYDGMPPAESLDMGPMVKEGNYFFRLSEGDRDAGWIGQFKTHPGCYEWHTNIFKWARGKLAFRFCQTVRNYMFLNTDAMELVTFTPKCIPGLDGFARLVGATWEFDKPQAWVRDGKRYDVGIWTITLRDWVRSVWRDFIPIGQRFHENLFALIPEDEHPEDEAHDGYVGLVCAMSRNQPKKAEAVYNSWAMKAGYAEVLVLHDRDEEGRIVVDIDSAIIAFDPVTMKVSVLSRRDRNRTSP